jgi:hypothetical protein
MYITSFAVARPQEADGAGTDQLRGRPEPFTGKPRQRNLWVTDTIRMVLGSLARVAGEPAAERWAVGFFP